MTDRRSGWPWQRAALAAGGALTIVASAVWLLTLSGLGGTDPVPDGAASPASPGSGGMWVGKAELDTLPMSGPGWRQLTQAADREWGVADLADQDQEHNTDTLAGALVYTRLVGHTSAEVTEGYREKTAEAVLSIIGTERGGRTLALGRNLAAYVIAAELIDLASYDPEGDRDFRVWLDQVRHTDLDGLTLIETHERRLTNWGTMAGASRIAAAIYLDDTRDLARAAEVFHGWTGNTAAYDGFSFTADRDWFCDPDVTVGINPAGCTLEGHDVDGVLPAELFRGGGLSWPPEPTAYAWGGLQGAIVQTELLHRQGFGARSWSDHAMRRAYDWLAYIDQLDPEAGWWGLGDNRWQPVLANHMFGTDHPTFTEAGVGKIMGWTEWTHDRPTSSPGAPSA